MRSTAWCANNPGVSGLWELVHQRQCPVGARCGCRSVTAHAAAQHTRGKHELAVGASRRIPRRNSQDYPGITPDVALRAAEHRLSARILQERPMNHGRASAEHQIQSSSEVWVRPTQISNRGHESFDIE